MQKEEEENLIQAMLPDGYNYKFVKYELEQNDLEEIKFCLEARVNVSNQTHVKQFVAELNQSTG